MLPEVTGTVINVTLQNSNVFLCGKSDGSAQQFALYNRAQK